VTGLSSTIERLFALETFGIKLGLANISALCAALGHPERAFASLHIAGTNGKGSVTAITHAALLGAGVRAARYTSPHLVTVNERFVIGDAAVDDRTLEAAAQDVLRCADDLQSRGILGGPPTFFEATTAIAFELFKRAGVEVAVFEVGLGGRFDATNVIAPAVTAITSIGFDHQKHLGDTLPQIAFEKAGIIKPGVPVIVGRMPADAEATIRDVAHARGSRTRWVAREFDVSQSSNEGRIVFEAAGPGTRYGPLALALRGEHQVDNALVAIGVLEEARHTGIPITSDAIQHGLAHAEWPARLEMLTFAGGRRLLIDAAHNVDGAAALAAYLARWHAQHVPLVFAAMHDKDVAAILRSLLPAVGTVLVTAAPTPRAASPSDLAEAVRSVDPSRRVVVEADPVCAVERAWEESPLVCVAGSIFLAGAVRDALHGRAIVDSPR
jgi:dihydrofolate synthase/folylpolyglutamate synthase